MKFFDTPRDWPKEALVNMEKAFADARGLIQPLTDLPVNSALLISSKKGAVRGNHYHKSDWHFCYMLEGEMEYWERPVGSRAKPKIIKVKPGQMLFTPPGVEHAMRFSRKTVWVVLSRNPRDRASYESDVVRVKLL